MQGWCQRLDRKPPVRQWNQSVYKKESGVDWHRPLVTWHWGSRVHIWQGGPLWGHDTIMVSSRKMRVTNTVATPGIHPPSRLAGQRRQEQPGSPGAARLARRPERLDRCWHVPPREPGASPGPGKMGKPRLPRCIVQKGVGWDLNNKTRVRGFGLGIEKQGPHRVRTAVPTTELCIFHPLSVNHAVSPIQTRAGTPQSARQDASYLARILSGRAHALCQARRRHTEGGQRAQPLTLPWGIGFYRGDRHGSDNPTDVRSHRVTSVRTEESSLGPSILNCILPAGASEVQISEFGPWDSWKEARGAGEGGP